MAKNNATTQPTAPRVTKMEHARALYAEVTASPAPEGKSHRGIFIERAEAIGLSKPAANTYFQKLKNEGGTAAPVTTGVKEELQRIRTMATELNAAIGNVAKKVA